jgi:hypothetical protein
MKKRELAVHSSTGLARAGAHYHPIRAIGGLAHFHEANGRQAPNSIDLQLQLLRVQVPEPFTETADVAVSDLRNSTLDRPDIAAIVEVELQQSEQQRDRGAEQEDTGEEAQTNPAAQAVKRRPSCPDPGELWRSDPGFSAILALVRRLILRHCNLIAAPDSQAPAHGTTTGKRRRFETITQWRSRVSYGGSARTVPKRLAPDLATAVFGQVYTC